MEYIVSYITYMHGSLSSSWDAKLARNLGNMGSDRHFWAFRHVSPRFGASLWAFGARSGGPQRGLGGRAHHPGAYDLGAHGARGARDLVLIWVD